MVILGDLVRPKTLKCATTAYSKLIKSVDDFDRREWPLDPGETFGEGQQLMRYLVIYVIVCISPTKER